MQNNRSILIGNSFPLSLIRRPIHIQPASLSELQEAAEGKSVVSFWGHANSLGGAEAFSGLSLMPNIIRPAVRLQQDRLPLVEGQIFEECWVLSPDYAEGCRPAVGEEVPLESIAGWQVLRLTWE